MPRWMDGLLIVLLWVLSTAIAGLWAAINFLREWRLQSALELGLAVLSGVGFWWLFTVSEFP